MAKTKNSKETQNQELVVLKDKYARALADYQNLEKRVGNQQIQLVQLANAALLTKFLTLLDHLELASAHLADPGLKLVIDQFQKYLGEEQVVEIEALGKVYDPHTMECTDRVPGELDRVVAVEIKGYRLHQHLLRPARVKVGNGQVGKTVNQAESIKTEVSKN